MPSGALRARMIIPRNSGSEPGMAVSKAFCDTEVNWPQTEILAFSRLQELK
jgi:hypothetical protein